MFLTKLHSNSKWSKTCAIYLAKKKKNQTAKERLGPLQYIIENFVGKDGTDASNLFEKAP